MSDNTTTTTKIHAAVVTPGSPGPKYQTTTLPAPKADEVQIKVLATGLHQLVRSRASGTHYSTATAPGAAPPGEVIPGVDGVGRECATDKLVYFIALNAATGSFAEYVNVAKTDVYPLPDGNGEDVGVAVAVAAAVNPVMSSWMALACRAQPLLPGLFSNGTATETEKKKEKAFSVAVLGATGASGSAAVEVARALGATKVVAVGRNAAKLKALPGVDETIALENDLTSVDFAAAADVDVVLDYLWGETSAVAARKVLEARKDRARVLVWVEIGSMAGTVIPLDAQLLRKANVFFCGCGPGSWTFGQLAQQLPALLEAVVKRGISPETDERKLEDVEEAWMVKTDKRMVFTP